MANEIPKDFLKSSAETTVPSSVGDGEDVKAWLDEYGRIAVVQYDTSGNEPTTRKEEVTLLASAARTAETASDAQSMPYHKGVLLFVDVTVDAAAGAITPTIEINDSVGSTAAKIWEATSAINATGQFTYLLHPGATDAANYTETVETTLPTDWTFRMTVADTDSLTYSVTAVFLP